MRLTEFEKLTCTGDNASLAQEILRAKRPTQHRLGGSAHPAVQHRGVDGAEIDSIFQVAVLVQAAKAWWLTVDVLVDRIAQNENGSRGGIIANHAVVFFHALP